MRQFDLKHEVDTVSKMYDDVQECPAKYRGLASRQFAEEIAALSLGQLRQVERDLNNRSDYCAGDRPRPEPRSVFPTHDQLYFDELWREQEIRDHHPLKTQEDGVGKTLRVSFYDDYHKNYILLPLNRSASIPPLIIEKSGN